MQVTLVYIEKHNLLYYGGGHNYKYTANKWQLYYMLLKSD